MQLVCEGDSISPSEGGKMRSRQVWGHESLLSCPTLCNPIDCNLEGFSVHGILQARILEWVAIPFSRGSSQPRDRTLDSCIASRFFTI